MRISPLTICAMVVHLFLAIFSIKHSNNAAAPAAALDLTTTLQTVASINQPHDNVSLVCFCVFFSLSDPRTKLALHHCSSTSSTSSTITANNQSRLTCVQP
ncbi:hypothetical protein B0T17DRAFT_530654 [Bombardia bombarda]|uniref:Secreted protein n=1 Tax=Bombardia bombarda TaxID=252184 RepID=A0AA40C4D9_9PEZI|nr:hypothetical protein B0T17DRAFT_530654 [Bombardia bombarda]